jgi:hypothetical protein
MDTIFDFLGFLLQAFLWYLLFNFIFNFAFSRKEKNIDAEVSELTKKLEEIVHMVSIEQHGTVYYWFDADDGEFLGQGTCTEEVIAHVKSRFPTHLFFLPTQELVNAPDWKPKPFTLKTVD